jgi:hypothetical protein
MGRKMIEKNYCVYRHIRKDTNQVFYVGLGLKERPKRISGRNEIWNRIINKTEWFYEIIMNELTLEEAQQKEIEFIKLYGRINTKTGTLANMTDGGEGCVGTLISEKHKKRISECNKGRKLTEEHKKKISQFQKGRIDSEETKLKKSESLKGLKKTEEHKLNQSLSQTKYNFKEIYLNNKELFDTKSESIIKNTTGLSKGTIHRIRQYIKNER